MKNKKHCPKLSKKKSCSLPEPLSIGDYGFPEKKRKEKLVRITMRVTPTLKRELIKEAKKEKLSFSAYCNEALIVSIMNANL